MAAWILILKMSLSSTLPNPEISSQESEYYWVASQIWESCWELAAPGPLHRADLYKSRTLCQTQIDISEGIHWTQCFLQPRKHRSEHRVPLGEAGCRFQSCQNPRGDRLFWSKSIQAQPCNSENSALLSIFEDRICEYQHLFPILKPCYRGKFSRCSHQWISLSPLEYHRSLSTLGLACIRYAWGIDTCSWASGSKW